MRVAAMLLFALVPNVAVAATTASGLEGTVMQGPTKPVCRTDDSCEEPARRLVLQFRRDGRLAAEVTTTATGAYKVGLKPGRYTVAAPARRIGVGLTPRTIRVPRGHVAHVDFHLDSGLQ